uniref:Uncharacterized protein n=1 Tax=Zooxanthella nutricula TaxID=1333877 RepID=A0A7S2JUM2_9DINO|mmetsp:Transcript_36420/g.110123  ORF Transcript_36420/g.110123 Transcript_36420/m.110123 type:complete len:108 (+) Transcript_36420:542-865(+)
MLLRAVQITARRAISWRANTNRSSTRRTGTERVVSQVANAKSAELFSVRQFYEGVELCGGIFLCMKTCAPLQRSRLCRRIPLRCSWLRCANCGVNYRRFGESTGVYR